MKIRKLLKHILISISVILLLINIIGFLFPLRNSEIYLENKTLFKNDITLTEKQLLNLLSKKKISNKKFVIAANNLINQGIAHYWLDEGVDKYNLRVPIYENYILFTASYLLPSSFKKYEYCNLDKAIERGVGLCSQHSIILSQILSRKKIDSKIIGLSGHVVVMAKVDNINNIWWVLDPDYGVVIKENIYDIQNEPLIIFKYYKEKGFSDQSIELLVDIYNKKGNTIYENVFDYCGFKKYYFEKLSYYLIWIIPISILVYSFFLKTFYQ